MNRDEDSRNTRPKNDKISNMMPRYESGPSRSAVRSTPTKTYHPSRSQLRSKPPSLSAGRYTRNLSRPLSSAYRSNPPLSPTAQPVLSSTPEKAPRIHTNEHDENFSPTAGVEKNNPQISQRPFAANRIPLRSKVSKPQLLPSNTMGKRESPALKISIRNPSISPRKIRKPIDSQTFRPASPKVLNPKIRDWKRPLDMSVPETEDRSGFPEWEFIDWPWVTPYAPLEKIVLLSDVRQVDVLFMPLAHAVGKCSFQLKDTKLPWPQKKKTQALKCPKSLDPLTTILPLNHPTGMPSQSTLCQTDEVSNDKFFNSTRSRYRIRPRRRENTQSDQIPSYAVTWNHSTLPIGPTHPTHHEHSGPNTAALMGPSHNPSLIEPLNMTLMESLNEFIKNVAQMRRGDRRLVEEFLEALKNVDSDEYGPNKVGRESAENAAAGNCKPRKTGLNPSAPDFKCNTCSRPDIIVAPQEKFVQKTSTRQEQLSLQERQPRNSQMSSVESNKLTDMESTAYSTQVGRKENRTKFNFKQKQEPVWIKTATKKRQLNTDADLLEACLNKLSILESETLRPTTTLNVSSPIISTSTLHESPDSSRCLVELIPAVFQPTTLELASEHDSPGREAKAMEPMWANRMLNQFMAKYPMTGVVKSDPVINIKKKIASDIQQRLEYLLLVRKEKEVFSQFAEAYEEDV